MSNLPKDAVARKALPVATGVLNYFPDALLAVAEVSRVGNEQHNPGQPLHWAKHLSTDHADSLLRHLIDAGTFDADGVRHSAKVAWRALALLQTELENAETTARSVKMTEESLAREFAGPSRSVKGQADFIESWENLPLVVTPIVPAPEARLPLEDDPLPLVPTAFPERDADEPRSKRDESHGGYPGSG